MPKLKNLKVNERGNLRLNNFHLIFSNVDTTPESDCNKLLINCFIYIINELSKF